MNRLEESDSGSSDIDLNNNTRPTSRIASVTTILEKPKIRQSIPLERIQQKSFKLTESAIPSKAIPSRLTITKTETYSTNSSPSTTAFPITMKAGPIIKESDSDSSFSSSTSSDSEISAIQVPELKYIPKSERTTETIADTVETLETKDDNIEFIVQYKQTLDKKESSQLSALQKQINAIDDTDEETIEEYEKWKIRELKRLVRNKEEKLAYEQCLQQVQEFRDLPEEQKDEIFAKKLIEQQQKEENKTQYGFLQKYYHKGAYFQDNDNILVNRDYNVATGEDKLDKTNLPEFLKVKNLGKRGRSKWTHLSNEDTTDKHAWGEDESISKKQKF